jgi:Ca2+/Na+ antiporter
MMMRELDFITHLSVVPLHTLNAATARSLAHQQRFSKMDYLMLIATVLLFVIFIYLMYLNYRDWKIDRQNVDNGKDKISELYEIPAVVVNDAHEKELNAIMEKISKTSEANTSLTNSTKEDEPANTNLDRWIDPEASSLQGTTISGLSDIAPDGQLPPDGRGNISIDGTVPSSATSDVFDMVDDSLNSDHTAPWMKQIRISVVESMSLASGSFQNSLITTSSSLCSDAGLEGSQRN